MATTQDGAVIEVDYECVPLPNTNTHIRLIKILEAAEGQTVRCRVTAWSVPKVTTYVAISYTWGDPDCNSQIQVNDTNITVRSNCEYVLRQAFNYDPDMYFWVDSICINQRDDIEKGAQVAMMGDIFHAAKLVLSCLGPHANESEVLSTVIRKKQSFLDEVAKALTTNSDLSTYAQLSYGWLFATRREIFGFWRWHFSVTPSTHCRIRKALQSLVDRPYFGRAWVVQEVALAQNVLLCCGMDVWTISHWYSLAFLMLMKESGHYLYSHHLFRPLRKFWQRSLSSVSDIVPLRHAQATFIDLATAKTKNYMSIEDLIENMVLKECSDLRDRIYAALQLVDWGENHAIKPDYSVSAFDVGLEILNYLGSEDSGPEVSRIIDMLRLHFRDETGNIRPQFRFDWNVPATMGRPPIIYYTTGFLQTSRINSQSCLWYRRGFEPCSCTITSHVNGNPTKNQTEETHNSESRMPVFERYDCCAQACDETRLGCPSCIKSRLPKDWIVRLNYGYSVLHLGLIARQSSANRYLIVGYSVYAGPDTDLPPMSDDEFTVYFEPQDMLRTFIVGRAALQVYSTSDLPNFAAQMDGIAIFRSLDSTIAVKRSEADGNTFATGAS